MEEPHPGRGSWSHGDHRPNGSTSGPAGGREGSDREGESIVLQGAPDSQTLSVIAEARRRGIRTVTSGFLPDEVAGDVVGARETLGWFVTRFEFRPYLLPEAGSPAEERGAVLLVTDRCSPAGRRSSIAAYCEAMSEAIGRPQHIVDANALSPGELARELAGAAVVVNLVGDWSLGFAIDTAAVRAGRPVIRPDHPGYSPLRYAVLGLTLPAPGLQDVSRIRTWSTSVIRPGANRMRTEAMQAWLFDASCTDRWRRMMDRSSWMAFWGRNQDFGRPFSDSQVGANWLERPLSWCALAAAQDPETFPAEAAAVVTESLTQALTGQLQRHARGVVSDHALGRWVRLHPEWLESMGKANIDRRNLTRAVRRWTERGIACGAISAPLLPLVRSAAPILRSVSDGGTGIGAALAWGTSWSEVVRLSASGTPATEPMWRATCARLCWDRIGPLSRTEIVGEAERRMLRALLADSQSWHRDLGGAAAPLRVISALRWRDVAAARRAWRDARDGPYSSTAGGLARLIRVAFPDGAGVGPWLHHAALGDGVGPLATGLVKAWYAMRLRDLWRSARPIELARELSRARSLLEQHRGDAFADAASIHLAARLAALELDDVGVATALREYTMAQAGESRELPAAVALIQALRGRPEAGAATLRAWPDATGEVFAIFLRGMAWLWSGHEDTALELIRRSIQIEARFLSDVGVPGARWALMALALQRLGLTEDAARFRELAKRHSGHEHFLDRLADLAPGSTSRACEWSQLIRP